MRTVAIFGLSGLLVVRGAMAVDLPPVLRPLLPPPGQTPNIVPLSPGQQLGKDIFFDHTLSNPEGYACATCHIPQSWALAGSPMMATNTTMCCTLPGGIIGNTQTFVMIKQQ